MKIKITKLDRLFSHYTRLKAGYKCERCVKQYQPPTKALHNSHYHGRRKKSVRWDEDNCSSLCHGCHSYFTANPLKHTEWMQKKLGNHKFTVLQIRANLCKPVNEFEVNALEIYYTDKIKELEENGTL